MAGTLALAACSKPLSPASAPIVGPDIPADPQSPPSSTVSGTVWIHRAGGAEPSPGGQLFGWLEFGASGRTTGRVDIAANGRYQFSVPAGAIRVRVFGGPGYQPCAVTVQPAANGGDVAADIHTIVDPLLLGGNLPEALRSQEPTLSGMVYEQTPDGRRPVPNVWVSLDGLHGLGLLIAETLTGADGRYALCRVPHLPGLTIYASLTDFQLFEYSADLIGKQTLDIELRRVSR